MKIKTLTININLLKFSDSDLLIAVSNELPGLNAPGRTREQIERNIEAGIRFIFEEQGKKVISVSTVDVTPDLPDFILPGCLTATATLEAT